MATVVTTEHVDLRETKVELGDWPIVVAVNHVQHELICRALGLSPHRTTSGSAARRVEGTRPTSIIYGPNWRMLPDSEDIAATLERTSIKLPKPPLVVHLRQGEF